METLTNNVTTVNSDLEFIRYLRQTGGETMKKCFQCATCSVACGLSPQEYAFPRKEMLWAGWGMKDKLLSDPDIWLCHGCMDCSQQCPRSAKPADLMGAIRSFIYRNFAFPGFMGRALASPKYLAWLFLVPVLLIFGLVLVSQGGDLSALFTIKGQVLQYKDFIQHGPLELLFIGGNVLIFAFAFVGFKRYWNNLKTKDKTKSGKGFIRSAGEVGLDFMLHRKFSKCPSNSNRYYGHLYIFYGFIGTIIATAFVVVNEFRIFGSEFLPYPMNIEHPLKIFGLLSGALLILGGILFMIRRYKAADRETSNTYNDMLFLWVLWGVAFTGVLSVFARLTQETYFAYPVYFIHLVLVFFLLWYMPYSKFAHMIYRFIGLTFLKMHNREFKPGVFVVNGTVKERAEEKL